MKRKRKEKRERKKQRRKHRQRLGLSGASPVSTSSEHQQDPRATVSQGHANSSEATLRVALSNKLQRLHQRPISWILGFLIWTLQHQSFSSGDQSHRPSKPFDCPQPSNAHQGCQREGCATPRSHNRGQGSRLKARSESLGPRPQPQTTATPVSGSTARATLDLDDDDLDPDLTSTTN